MTKLYYYFLWATLLLYITPTIGQDDIAKKIYSTAALSLGAPVIDGLLDDASWDQVAWGDDFIENEPNENTPPTFQTKFKITYDEKNIYVAIKCYDSAPDSIISRLSRRDGFVGDRVNVLFDSYADERTGFVFTVTAAGVKGDEFVTDNGGNIDDSWNPIWFTKSNIDSEGWTAEMKIPLSQLRFGKAESQNWGLQVVRRIVRVNETSVWQRVPLDAPGFVSAAGMLEGINDIKAQKQLEIQPFLVTQADRYPAEPGNPFRDGSDNKINLGLDAKIGITNDLTLDLTVNPDFGQVEADPGAIALDGFQIFFREQRPFFVENKNIFDYEFANGNDNIFYSRRIGRSPQGSVNLQDGDYVDRPSNTTILGAAKFSGKTKNGLSIGILESLTASEYATIDNNGNRSEQIVEPLTNYFVSRVQKDFNNRQSFIGGIFTSTNRRLDGQLSNLVTDAYTGGLDFTHQWQDRTYYLRGNIVASHVSGSTQAITALQRNQTHLFNREDATHVSVNTDATSMFGTGGKLEYGKAGSGHIRYELGALWRSPGLELNDIGFLRSSDDIRQYGEISYSTLRSGSFYRAMSTSVEFFTTYDFQGNFNRLQLEWDGEINWTNNWFTNAGFGHKPRILITSFLRGGPRWRFSTENFMYLFVGSDRSKKFSFVAGYIYSSAKQNNFSFNSLRTNLRYQPIDALSLSLELEYSNNPNRTQYVTTQPYKSSSRYILGEIDNKTAKLIL